MRIYHKKNFAAGLFMLALSVFPIAQGIREGFGLPVVWRLLLCAGGGLWAIARSLSRDSAREDLIRERDERNRANLLRSKSLAFDATLWGGLAAALVLAFCDWGSRAPGPCAYIAAGLFFASAFGFIAQSLALLYLDRHS